jgi:hypothetical protein
MPVAAPAAGSPSRLVAETVPTTPSRCSAGTAPTAS